MRFYGFFEPAQIEFEDAINFQGFWPEAARAV